MNYIKRPHYLDPLRRHRDRQIIKVVSGVRRAGKSVLFQLYKEGVTSNWGRRGSDYIHQFRRFELL